MPEKSATLGRVLKGQLCSGCGGCAAVSDGAIAMEVADPGYARPHQLRPIPAPVEHAIATLCPGARIAPWPDAEATHPYWGPYRQVMTGHANDEALRHHASSGGLVSALSIHALRSGRVDAVLHVTADPERPTRNILTLSRTAEEVFCGAGSRYAPSSPLAGIDRILDGKERVAFIGKPCDASAIRLLATVDDRVKDRIPLVLSFFCGGIPSHAGANAILHQLGLTEQDVAQFKYRGDGWPGLATATRHDGSTEQMSYMDSWGAHLSKVVQHRCKICPDAVGGVADIVCADAWHGDARGYPLFEEQDGRSLLITRTEVGESLVTDAVASGAISVRPQQIGIVDSMQPSQAKRKRLVLSRLLALRFIGRPVYQGRGVLIGNAARRAPIMEALRSFAGMIRRSIRS